jgi:hypothetical protein
MSPNSVIKKNYVVIIIHPDGTVTKVVQKKDPSLEQLQAAVGGYIQEAPRFTQLAINDGQKVFAYNHGKCYCNEDGKLSHMNLPFNMLATEAWKGQYAYVDDHFVGDVVFVARTTEECTTP